MPKRRTAGRASAASLNDERRNAERIGTIKDATGSPSWNGNGVIGNQPSLSVNPPAKRPKNMAPQEFCS